ncbi:MAG: hypothetical protein M3Y20_08850, partial [Actinomycetota bacterium]|nr:hypothetical protein [Actinomycetota bacterium]
ADTGLDATGASAAPSSATPAVSRDILKARYGTFASKTLKGTGTKVIKLPKGATRGLVTVSARGKGTITVQVLKKNRKKQGRAVVAKQALPYAGTAVYGLELGQYDPTYLKVSSTSAKRWTVKVQPLHRAKAMKKKQKGSGDAVFRVTVTKPKKWSISYRSDVKKNFSVTTYGLIRSQVLVDKATAKYSGKVRVEDFSGFVVVRSQGRWTLKR